MENFRNFSIPKTHLSTFKKTSNSGTKKNPSEESLKKSTRNRQVFMGEILINNFLHFSYFLKNEFDNILHEF